MENMSIAGASEKTGKKTRQPTTEEYDERRGGKKG